MSSDPPTDLHQVWATIIDNTAPAQRVWLSSSRPVMHAENTFVLAVPNDFTQNQFVSKLRFRVEEQLAHALGHSTRLVVTVDAPARGTRTGRDRGRPPAGRPPPGRPRAPDHHSPGPDTAAGSTARTFVDKSL